VPPHDFDVDFPKLMLRHKALLNKQKAPTLAEKALSHTDYVFPIASQFSTITNKINNLENKAGRIVLSTVADIHPEAYLPKFQSEILMGYGKKNGFLEKSSQKVALFATCLGNYSEVDIGESALNVFKKIGVKVEQVYTGCCGMPLLEQGKVKNVADKALNIAEFFKDYIDNGYTIVSLIPSCSLMIKNEWPLLHPMHEDIKKLSHHIIDLCEVTAFYGKGKDVFRSIEEESILLYLAYHARAQNQGPKAAEMLRLVKGLKVKIIERSSGHSGNFGIKNDTFDIAIKVGIPVVHQYEKENENIESFVISECPLAGHHIPQGLNNETFSYKHPMQILEHFLK
jgi:glycerol-3-phosphate dehydrogenase subunit C